MPKKSAVNKQKRQVRRYERPKARRADGTSFTKPPLKKRRKKS